MCHGYFHKLFYVMFYDRYNLWHQIYSKTGHVNILTFVPIYACNAQIIVPWYSHGVMTFRHSTITYFLHSFSSFVIVFENFNMPNWSLFLQFLWNIFYLDSSNYLLIMNVLFYSMKQSIRLFHGRRQILDQDSSEILKWLFQNF